MKIRGIIEKTIGLAILTGFIMGLVLVVFVPVELCKMAEARAWPSRKGLITVSHARRVSSVRRPAYWQAEIGGRFLDNGEKFWVSRVRYGDFRFGEGKASAMETVAKYSVGSEVDVYYSPTHPRQTILEPLAPWHTMGVAFGVGIGFVLLPVVLFVFRKQLGHAGH